MSSFYCSFILSNVLSGHMNRLIRRALILPKDIFVYGNRKNIYCSVANMIKMSESEDDVARAHVKMLLPDLKFDNHKGQCGRIGVFGGSLEFTGAPYYSGYSALRCGVDLVYVFCAASAAQAIKSYSPELMVMPYLDTENGVEEILNWIERLHAILIGPGLGRNEHVFRLLVKIINYMNSHRPLPIVIDADGLFFLTKYPDILKNYKNNVYITPNAMEYTRLLQAFLGKDIIKSESQLTELSKVISNNATVVLKGHVDVIAQNNLLIKCFTEGSPRRCGGQGDLLAGILTAFAAWIDIKKLKSCNNDLTPELVAGYSACYIVRNCNKIVFAEKGRGMLVTDMLDKVLEVCNGLFGPSDLQKYKSQ